MITKTDREEYNSTRKQLTVFNEDVKGLANSHMPVAQNAVHKDISNFTMHRSICAASRAPSTNAKGLLPHQRGAEPARKYNNPEPPKSLLTSREKRLKIKPHSISE